MKDRGRFVCEPDSLGRHGDTFDSTKLGLHGLASKSGSAQINTNVQMGGTALGVQHRDPRQLSTWIDDETPRARHMAG